MPVDLLSTPRCHAGDLGLPMPDDPHAVSACLPLWEHNIGYEEGRPDVIDVLQAAYPRFCFHPQIRALSDRYLNSGSQKGLPFATRSAAERAVAYVGHAANAEAQLVELPQQSSCGVTVDVQHFSVLRQYWQHAGENVSSRVAERMLAGFPAGISDCESRRLVRERVGNLYSVSSDHVYLYASGMAAIAHAWRAIQSTRSGSSCQFGFPYVDTLKVQQRFPGASHVFLPMGDAADMERLAECCRTATPDMVFCEVPTNPLLQTPDLAALRSLADKYNFLLIVDDTLAACGNLDVLSSADLVVTSLTKYFSGQGNVLAGSLVINPDGPNAADLKNAVSETYEETLSDIDVDVLAANSGDVSDRVSRINASAAALAEFLEQHPAVDRVYYPSRRDPAYEALRRPNGGYGGLLSVVLQSPEESTPPVFDALEVCKGPNLGTVFTLCCPYTILAHYNELDFAEECGVSRWLLRISVGVESADDLIGRFDKALEAASG